MGLLNATKENRVIKGAVEDELIEMLEDIWASGHLYGVLPHELYNLAQVFPLDPDQAPTTEEAQDLAERALHRLRGTRKEQSWGERTAALRDAIKVQEDLVREKEDAIAVLMGGPLGDVAAAKATIENDLRPLVAHLNWLRNELARAASMVGEEFKEGAQKALDFDVAVDTIADIQRTIRQLEAKKTEIDEEIALHVAYLREMEAEARASRYREHRSKMWDDVDEGMFILKRKRDQIQTELNRLTVTLERRKQEWARLSSMLDNPGTEDSAAQQINLRRSRQAIDEEIDILHEQYQEVEAELNAINIELADIMAIRPKERKTKDAAYFSKLARAIQEQKQYIQKLETELLVDLRAPDFRDLPESTKSIIVRRTQEVSDQLRKAKLDLGDMQAEWDDRPAEYKERTNNLISEIIEEIAALGKL